MSTASVGAQSAAMAQQQDSRLSSSLSLKFTKLSVCKGVFQVPCLFGGVLPWNF